MNVTPAAGKRLAIRWLEATGLALTVAALVWWAIVFAQVISNTEFPIARTLPCLLNTSDRCSLAMSLCRNWHFLGIRRYSPELLWAGAFVSCLALVLGNSAWRKKGA